VRLREIEEERIRRLNEKKLKEELKVEAERVQLRLMNELEGHQLGSQIFVQKLDGDRRSTISITPVESAVFSAAQIATPAFTTRQFFLGSFS
jgi:hypothetical protein